VREGKHDKLKSVSALSRPVFEHMIKEVKLLAAGDSFIIAGHMQFDISII
jgi:hypothetical protein